MPPTSVTFRSAGPGQALNVPFADALFCVVIGKRNGMTSAVGFIMPHGTANYFFKDKAVPMTPLSKRPVSISCRSWRTKCCGRSR